MNFTQMTKQLIGNTTNGIDTDLFIQTYSGNIIEQPFFQIELDCIEDLVFMAKNSKSYFIYPYPQGNEYLFTALYKATEKSPLARCYFVRKKGKEDTNKFRDLLKSQNLYFDEINDINFSIAIEMISLEERKERFLKRREEQTGAIKKIFDGRINDVKGSGGIILQSDNCLICNKSIKNYLSTTLSSDKNLFISFNVCENCYEEAKKYEGSNIEFLLNKFGINDTFFSSKKMSDKEILDITKNMLEEDLNCAIEDINEKKKNLEITARRHSGFKIILRLQRNNIDKIDYAYMIFNTNNEQVLRFDSAGHHNKKLGIAPDHLHYDLKTSNNLVKSSYLTGYLPLDVIILKTSVENLENL